MEPCDKRRNLFIAFRESHPVQDAGLEARPPGKQA